MISESTRWLLVLIGCSLASAEDPWLSGGGYVIDSVLDAVQRSHEPSLNGNPILGTTIIDLERWIELKPQSDDQESERKNMLTSAATYLNIQDEKSFLDWVIKNLNPPFTISPNNDYLQQLLSERRPKEPSSPVMLRSFNPFGFPWGSK